jgi:propanediol dehydratase large subunit
LEATKEARVDVLRHLCEDRGVHVAESGQEARVYRHGRGFAVGHAVLSQDVAYVLGLIQRNGTGIHVASNLRAKELREVTQVLDLKFCADASFERRQPNRIIAG